MKKPYHSPKLTPLDVQALLPELKAAARAGDVAAQKMLEHATKEKTSGEKAPDPIGCAV